MYQTGFNTLKGGLARAILYTKSKGFSFNRDSMRFLYVLFTLGGIQFIYTFFVLYGQGESVYWTIMNGIQMLTVTVPPALPATLGAGIQFAINRLKKRGVNCVMPDKINVAGKINICSFDKTGTLTELGLDIFGARPSTVS